MVKDKLLQNLVSRENVHMDASLVRVLKLLPVFYMRGVCKA